jgi:hypothetical protein
LIEDFRVLSVDHVLPFSKLFEDVDLALAAQHDSAAALAFDGIWYTWHWLRYKTCQ